MNRNSRILAIALIILSFILAAFFAVHSHLFDVLFGQQAEQAQQVFLQIIQRNPLVSLIYFL